MPNYENHVHFPEIRDIFLQLPQRERVQVAIFLMKLALPYVEKAYPKNADAHRRSIELAELWLDSARSGQSKAILGVNGAFANGSSYISSAFEADRVVTTRNGEVLYSPSFWGIEDVLAETISMAYAVHAYGHDGYARAKEDLLQRTLAYMQALKTS